MEQLALESSSVCDTDVPVKISLSREQIIEAQTSDLSPSSLFTKAVPDAEIDVVPSGYFLKDRLLMRKWRPLNASAQADWRVVDQIVVPSAYRRYILSLAHDHCLAGHLGVNKTYDRVMRHFFWPGLKADVQQFCKSCHFSQVARNPNHIIPPAPLYPFPVIGELF